MTSIWQDSLNQSDFKSIVTWSSFLFIGLISITDSNKPILAQITPDNSLGNDKSVVTPNQEINGVDADLIEGGAKRGENLFHSFQDFNIKEGRGAYFNNPSGIENILGRVTGGNVSQILGTLGVRGDANLFLLNSNGIIFGSNSSLDVGGSFLATTADSFVFDNGLEFGATNPESPPLLTVSTPIGLQFGSQPGSITNRSLTGEINPLSGKPPGLTIPSEQTLALVGGDIFLEGGVLTAPKRIEIGSVASNSFVNINPTVTGWQFNYNQVQNFQDIQLSQGALIYQANEINIQGKRITLVEGSQILSLGQDTQGIIAIIASDILEFKATDTTTGTSGFLVAIPGEFAVPGDTSPSNDIKIKTQTLSLQDGAQIVTFAGSSPLAESGNVTIEASELVEIKGASPNRQSVTLIDSRASGGSSGGVNINTKKLVLQDGGRIVTSTEGLGDAGTIEIKASDSVEIDGLGILDTNNGIRRSGLFARSESSAQGKAGDIQISTGRLLVQDGGEINTLTLSSGEGGDIIVKDSDSVLITGATEAVRVDGSSEEIRSRLVASTVKGNETGGNSGDIKIGTNRLVVEKGGRIVAFTLGNGDGGDIEINAEELVEVTGSSKNAFSSINSGGLIDTGEEPSQFLTGNAGNLTINAPFMSIRDGGEVAASNFGAGQGGELTIDVQNLELIGRGSLANGEIFPSSLRARARSSGNAGNLTIKNAENITIRDGASVAVSSTSEASGNAGDLNIFTTDLFVANKGEINVSAEGEGEAGSLKINVPNPDIPVNINLDRVDITLDNGSLTAETKRGNQGNITIGKADTLLLRNNSEITTNASESATGGDITINSEGIALLDNSDITANAIKGIGGDITITTQGIFQEPDSEITAASEENIDGTITINSPDVDPTSGLFELPSVTIDAEAILAQDLCKFEDDKIAKGSSFIITGRGGLTPTSADPLDNLDNVVRWTNRDEIKVSKNGVVGVRQYSESNKAEKSYPVIQQAQGWVTTADGSVWLVANAPETIPQNSRIVPPDCRALRQNKS